MPFKKGQPKTTGRQKGSKNKSTRVKEAIGVKNWNQMGEFLETVGAQKAAEELKKLKGKDFVNAFSSLSEFFKPKLARTEVLASVETNITWNEQKNYDDPDQKTDRGTGPAGG